MKIKSNKTFDCYDTAYESWSGGKDITLDGVKLIPITILDKMKDELIQSIQNGTLKIESGNEELFRIIDKYRAESKE